jgi:hypothetical protein
MSVCSFISTCACPTLITHYGTIKEQQDYPVVTRMFNLFARVSIYTSAHAVSVNCETRMPKIPVSCRSFQYSASNSLSSPSLVFRCSAILIKFQQVIGDRTDDRLTFVSIWSASARSSSTCRSLSRLSRAISSYSRCRRSIVRWFANFLSSACLCAL